MEPLVKQVKRSGSREGALAFIAATMALLLAMLPVALLSHVAQHSLKHARHQAPTHASPLCTWLCTAGEIGETIEVGLSAPPAIARGLEPWSPQEIVLAASIASPSRAPPHSFPSIRT